MTDSFGRPAMFEIFDEGRVTYEILDTNADITLAMKIEPARRAAVEPEDLVLRAEQEGAFGHRRRQAPELAQQPRHLGTVIILAAINPVDDGND